MIVGRVIEKSTPTATAGRAVIEIGEAITTPTIRKDTIIIRNPIMAIVKSNIQEKEIFP